MGYKGTWGEKSGITCYQFDIKDPVEWPGITLWLKGGSSNIDQNHHSLTS